MVISVGDWLALYWVMWNSLNMKLYLSKTKFCNIYSQLNSQRNIILKCTTYSLNNTPRDHVRALSFHSQHFQSNLVSYDLFKTCFVSTQSTADIISPRTTVTCYYAYESAPFQVLMGHRCGQWMSQGYPQGVGYDHKGLFYKLYKSVHIIKHGLN